jgi:hypothetical protein
MRTVYLLAIAVVAAPFPGTAQTGAVTFYSIAVSAKRQVKIALTPTGRVAFTGWLFDGDRRMAHATRGRFMTFHLPTGEHDFTVPYKSRGPGKNLKSPPQGRDDLLHLQVESGGHYCVRLSAKDVNPIVVPIMFVESKIERVSCQEAFQEAGTYKRIDLKRVDPAVLPEFDNSPDFPKDN